MALSSVIKTRLRLVVVTVALVPLALLARSCRSTLLQDFVQRGWVTAWKKYDASVEGDSR